MKKLALICLAVFAFYGQAQSMDNRKNYQQWRSSETGSIDTYVFIASGGPIIVHDVTVTSGTQAGTATFRIYNSTQDTNFPMNISQSTSSVFDIGTTGTRFDLDYFIENGLFYTKTGSSTIRIRWDWFLGPVDGQEHKGIKD